MHFSAKRGLAIACRPSVRSSVRLWRWWIVITSRWPSVHNFSGQSRILRACPEFWGLVPNFEGLSRKKSRSFGTLNCPEFRTMSRICPDLTSRCVKRLALDQNALDHFDVFARQRCVLNASLTGKNVKMINFCWAQNAPNLFSARPGPRWGSLRRSLIPPSGMKRAMPLSIWPTSPSTPFAASRSGRLEKFPEFLS